VHQTFVLSDDGPFCIDDVSGSHRIRSQLPFQIFRQFPSFQETGVLTLLAVDQWEITGQIADFVQALFGQRKQNVCQASGLYRR
jgi:hypothetical protein